MAFQQGLSGLNISAKSLDVISHNVANSNTVGFKSSQAVFSDVYSTTLGSRMAVQIGGGAALPVVRQSFTQGGITNTGNPLDMAINGDGFFMVRRPEINTPFYTRNGQFDFDKDGFIVTPLGDKLMGYPPGASSGDPQTLQFSFRTAGASATDSAALTLNLDSRAATIDPAAVPLNPADPTSYHYSSSLVVYDSLGIEHTMSMYFRKTGVDLAATPPATTWEVYSSLDGAAPTPRGEILFDGSGQYLSDTVVPSSDVLLNGADSPLAIDFDMRQATQFGTTFSIAAISQTGRSAGELAGLAVTRDGMIQARYTNGEIRDVGRVTLATFRNPNGLVSHGNNLWGATLESGVATPGSPASGTRGVIASGAVEESNIDLTSELVQMIIQQRAYQANAQSIRTQDQLLQTVINMR